MFRPDFLLDVSCLAGGSVPPAGPEDGLSGVSKAQLDILDLEISLTLNVP